jgi:formamidopyrimidine-DNA glycosylase
MIAHYNLSAAMPELPEVETVMRGLQSRLQGQRIISAVARRHDLRWPIPERLSEALMGTTVTGFRRRGKYILMQLNTGFSILFHLGMSGRMVLTSSRSNAQTPHEHLVLAFDEGWQLGFIDPRRFGSVDLMSTDLENRHRLLADLGPEPLEDSFTAPLLATALVGKRTSIKAALLDQTTVAGLGNIYICEALFRARISPLRSAHTILGARADRLVSTIKATLNEAIAAGGSSLRDYVQPDGELGYFQNAWKAYGREGEPCERCPGPPVCAGLRRIVQAGRSTFYCPRTQR